MKLTKYQALNLLKIRNEIDFDIPLYDDVMIIKRNTKKDSKTRKYKKQIKKSDFKKSFFYKKINLYAHRNRA